MAAVQSQQDPHAIARGETSARKRRGAVIARGNKILATGVSTHLGGELYKPETEERYVATVNAELVALGKCIRNGNAPLSDVSLYASDCPNWYTFKMLITIGIRRIVFFGPASNDRVKHAKELGVEILAVGG
jgi:deoxycytidylate deaminase